MTRDGVNVTVRVLVQKWPTYLGLELGSARPTLTLPDIAQIIEDRRTPEYNDMQSRPLVDAEVEVIQSWHEAASREQSKKLGDTLATVQNNISAQASAQHA